MRYIDIDELIFELDSDFISNWESKAERALDELRKEIENAELAAQISGEDVALARKKAITDGINKSSRQKIWKELADSLGSYTDYKCWYSESKNPGADKDVDHFRPKGSVKEDPDHEGYWWLTFDWRNYRYACTWCNQRRVDVIHSTDGGKWDHFPLGEGSFRARSESDDYYDEDDVELLDPTHPHDWKLLTFLPDGQPAPTAPEGTREYERAKSSIFFYHLDKYEFVRDRRRLVRRVQSIIERIETHRIQLLEPGTKRVRRLYIEAQKELLRLIDEKKAPYSAAALAYARSEIKVSQNGQPAERKWLDDMLSKIPADG
ncbi:MAG: hypothetical protein ACOYM4_14855 [Nodosilinea sp.]|jgi:hypothetical protein